MKLVTMTTARNLNPLIIFSFGKRECEAHVDSTHALDLNTGGSAHWGGGFTVGK